MAIVTFDPVLLRLVKELNQLGEQAQAIGHKLKDLAVLLGCEDLSRMMSQLNGVDKCDNASPTQPEA
jgi:hypothetical protein